MIPIFHVALSGIFIFQVLLANIHEKGDPKSLKIHQQELEHSNNTTKRFIMGAFEDQMTKASTGKGFIAALDQSGGSTPKALMAYGVDESEYEKGGKSMFDQVHEFRTRIMTSPQFDGDKVLGAILFEDTMDREVNGVSSSDYLWSKKIIPFLKVDKGLAEEENGVQLMKPIPGLDDLLKRANDNGVFGTKMRSVINEANEEGIRAIVEQQFDIGRQICAAGLVPVLEPEVNIKSPDKERCEEMLVKNVKNQLKLLNPGEKFMFKFSLPTKDNVYDELADNPNVVRIVALSGGYSRDEANKMLARQNNMIASFSRALTEGLKKQQSDEAFNKELSTAIDSIYDASVPN
jgi:fructose-bisphosphate aldolase class I